MTTTVTMIKLVLGLTLYMLFRYYVMLRSYPFFLNCILVP